MKLRKMLGEIDWIECKEIMKIIETQSKETLAIWGIEYVKENYLSIYREYDKDTNKEIEMLVDICEKAIKEKSDWKKIKPLLNDGRKIISKIQNLIAQASARAISTACAIYQTPTNALGFVFYGAAAKAYDQLGLDKTQFEYEEIAKKEWQKVLFSLKENAKPNELHPVKVKWNC